MTLDARRSTLVAAGRSHPALYLTRAAHSVQDQWATNYSYHQPRFLIRELSAAGGNPTPAETIGCRTEVQREADLDAGICIISRPPSTLCQFTHHLSLYIRAPGKDIKARPANNDQWHDHKVRAADPNLLYSMNPLSRRIARLGPF